MPDTPDAFTRLTRPDGTCVVRTALRLVAVVCDACHTPVPPAHARRDWQGEVICRRCILERRAAGAGTAEGAGRPDLGRHPDPAGAAMRSATTARRGGETEPLPGAIPPRRDRANDHGVPCTAGPQPGAVESTVVGDGA